ncbi:MAG TPA: DUF222 domain-containing protein [Candidatus Dormibacteraeota bacterium]|nr:DUF222 domain-containing protein [Candidatus Dormibacteraeota bacterium]
MQFGELERAIDALEDVEFSAEDLRRLRTAIHRLEKVFSCGASAFAREGGHLAEGPCTAAGWISRNCRMSASSAADRLCVGRELESLPAVSEAIEAGEIGYQSASLLCHLHEQIGDRLDEEQMVGYARQFTVAQLRMLCRHARHAADPDGFERDAEEDFERRWLHINPMLDGMHSVDGVLDPAGAAAVRSALDALSRPVGPEDHRNHGQRQADALVEMAHHALDSGRLPRRSGVKPHVSVTTTLEGLKGQLGAPAADVELSLPVGRRTLERLACDCTISRVLLQDSSVIDVGRATRVISGPLRRALHARDQGCKWPGCDRPVGWTSAHHIEFWGRGGQTRLHNLVLLCHQHHRNVHEGGWQVIRSQRGELRFLPPEHLSGVWARAA